MYPFGAAVFMLGLSNIGGEKIDEISNKICFLCSFYLFLVSTNFD